MALDPAQVGFLRLRLEVGGERQVRGLGTCAQVGKEVVEAEGRSSRTPFCPLGDSSWRNGKLRQSNLQCPTLREGNAL